MRQQRPLLSSLHPYSNRASADQPDASPVEAATDADELSARTGSAEHRSVAAADRPSLSRDVIFDLLRVKRRRMTLQFLRHHGPRSTLSTLASQLAAEENGIDVRAVTSTQRKRVYIALYQSHLPKMDDVGVVTFDAHRGGVELAANAALLYPYLDLEARQPSSSGGAGRVVAMIRQVGSRLISFDDGGDDVADSSVGRNDRSTG